MEDSFRSGRGYGTHLCQLQPGTIKGHGTEEPVVLLDAGRPRLIGSLNAGSPPSTDRQPSLSTAALHSDRSLSRALLDYRFIGQTGLCPYHVRLSQHFLIRIQLNPCNAPNTTQHPIISIHHRLGSITPSTHLIINICNQTNTKLALHGFLALPSSLSFL